MMLYAMILALPAAYAFFLCMRHNLHMLQLNGYKNDEHLRWLWKNKRQQWLLIFGLLLSILLMFFPNLPGFFTELLLLLLDIAVYRALRRLNTKKKLVYTARMKRLMVTICLLGLPALAFTLYCGGSKALPGLYLLMVSAQLFCDILANLINAPVEACIRGYYIRDAKKKLAAAHGLTVIGITGSYGKTSMKYFLYSLLKERFNVLITPGNFNTPLGVTITLRRDLKPSHEIFLCEMGARRVGEIKELCELAHPQHGIITSVGPQHLETFHSIENVQKTKFELADALPEGGMLFLNADNSYIRDAAGAYPEKISYGRGKDAAYRAEHIEFTQLGTAFDVTAPDGERAHFQMHLIGEHNVTNVCGAIAVAHQMGMPLSELKIPVRRLQPVEHRLELKKQGNVSIIDDAYNSNPEGSKAAVETLGAFQGIRILITPGMVELGQAEEEYNYQFGTYAAACCDHILLVGEKHTRPIRRGALDAGFPEKNCRVYERFEDALAHAYAIRGEGHKYILLENDLPDNY